MEREQGCVPHIEHKPNQSINQSIMTPIHPPTHPCTQSIIFLEKGAVYPPVLFRHIGSQQEGDKQDHPQRPVRHEDEVVVHTRGHGSQGLQDTHTAQCAHTQHTKHTQPSVHHKHRVHTPRLCRQEGVMACVS